MKRFLVFLFAISTLTASACMCGKLTLKEALSEADQVFIGTVLKRTHSDSDRVYYLVSVTTMFKGNKADSLIIRTGFGGGDCGVRFEAGKSYVIFSHQQYTDRCDGTDLVEQSIFIEKLKYLFEIDYAKNFGQTTTPTLTDKEAAYFNGELFFERSKFDFNQKKIAFMSGSSISTVIDKQQYFANWGGKDIENSLLVLTEKEKMESGGFDAIIISWSKIKIGRKGRKRMIAKLRNDQLNH